MRMSKITLCFVFILIIGGHCIAQNRTPVAAAKAFYAYDRAHNSAFTKAAVDARKQWFSAALYKLFLYEIKRQNDFLRENPGEKPYFGDGMPFQPYDELCTVGKTNLHKKLTIKPDSQDTATASVFAVFEFPPPCKTPDTTTYTIKLVRSATGWVIDDVVYEEGQSLVKDLNRTDY